MRGFWQKKTTAEGIWLGTLYLEETVHICGKFMTNYYWVWHSYYGEVIMIISYFMSRINEIFADPGIWSTGAESRSYEASALHLSHHGWIVKCLVGFWPGFELGHQCL